MSLTFFLAEGGEGGGEGGLSFITVKVGFVGRCFVFIIEENKEAASQTHWPCQ
jgi:hypothetical protein